ncbi:hypothetical protein GUITHDRAFT_150414 [Guillardia theta CCMP2712]|uniref:Uncharacterized protein n=1 Tax=Guillardia theta (strain CCMP2712) TaxID=905079 RepID=L1JZ24_GUITC|nr:hypothetical protein GUITHDRAFT_150414 [Guillardia theta CCMP2712]EKX53465.1 hypothetical protein GUITHDRAFT_150414 [Guillardia theta CCMP2712]|eukprot:XP_005840445.1 hypothetical protein GUITHDRAFT_150414 [Guillardia theta CCMP2712]
MGCRLAMVTMAVLVVMLQLQPSQSMDVQWIPADADGPLPMSSDYRQKLAELCKHIMPKGGVGEAEFSPDVPKEKQKVILKLCKKLRTSQRASDRTHDEPASIFWLLLLVAGIGFLGYQRAAPGSPLQSYRSKKLLGKGKKLDQGSMSSEEAQKAREARLQRFEKKDNNTPIVD